MPAASRKIRISAIALLLVSFAAGAQTPRAADFNVACDTLTARCNRRFSVISQIKVEKVMARDGSLDLYFARGFSDYPWHEADITWFLSEFGKESASVLGENQIGRCMASGTKIEELATPVLTRNGRSPSFAYKMPNQPRIPLVRRPGANRISRGLSGRHIALWQSHGLYYNEEQDRWKWQRATLHRTVEDMFTQSYVLDYLIPMLENAGAYVMTPRERDIQRQEVICDNDSAFVREPKGAPLRVLGSYTENGNWESGVTGFADLKQEYEVTDNPFTMGTTRTAWCSVTPAARAVWTPVIPERGEYAVYVSYASTRNSCRAAHYTVRHMGGDTEFEVDQRKGGSTWVYLGTFEFGPGTSGHVELDNRGNAGETVSADAVRFGGGMGNIARNGVNSGMPRALEGARYYAQWAGMPYAVYSTKNGENDYSDDINVRSLMTNLLGGGSCYMPNIEGRKVPIELSLAIHSDAGYAADGQSIYGPLAICTTDFHEGKLAAGISRQASYDL
ncbi:MAG: xanthan lyase, partial [Bacteroidales bacterium]|nr:xanthan lyase [Bacteroidales bacterium]